MVQISGKYEHVKSEGFVEMLVARGTPESEAKKIDSEKNLEVKVDGNTITTIDDKRTHTYELGKEVEEKGGPNNDTFKNTASLNGNVLSISTTFSDGKTRRRDLVFSDSGVELVLHGLDGAVKVKRIYKRV